MNLKKYTTLLLLAFAGLTKNMYGQTRAMVQEEAIKISGITTEAQVYPLTVSQKATSRTYTDGVGRPLQSIAVKASPSQKDLIQPMAYDTLGRQSKAYLPYAGSDGSGAFRSDAITVAQPAFYLDNLANKIAVDSMPYSQQMFENSPLQRVLSAGGVGTGFQPVAGQHFTTANYRSNNSTADGSIINWGPDGAKLGTYTDNTLTVTEGTDADQGKAIVFTDKGGRTILKRQWANTTVGGVSVPYFDTYYIYNNAGQVSYMVPPKATELIKANAGYTLATTAVSSLLFKFVYDDRARIIEKTVPGTGPVSIIYDPLDRVVLMQSPNLKLTNKWNYIKYDVKGHAIMQGLYTNSAAPAAMQATVSAIDYSTNWYESRSAVSADGYYTNNCFPTTGTELLGSSYYDDYDLNYNGSDDYSYILQGLVGQATSATKGTRGMLTMTRLRTMGPGLSNKWLTNALFYDKYGQAIQVRSTNHLNATMNSSKTTSYSFTGTAIQSKDVKIVRPGTVADTTTVLSSFAYDHMDRLTLITQRYNNAADSVKLAGYTYNELGQLIDKKLHSPNTGSTWLQSVDYRYSISGQLSSINNSKLTNDGVLNDDSNDVFGMELLYNKTDANIGNTASYTGRVSAVKWMSLNAAGTKSYERSYKYSYDVLNRYTASGYAERTAAGTGSFSNNIGGFDEYGISYDENGNLLSLKRNSSTQGTNAHIQVDSLLYTYDSSSMNKLTKVTDGTGANYTGYGFRNLTASTGNYAYESTTGNLITDPYKGISLTYNNLNRSERITISTGKYTDYTYDAAGTLLRKRVYNSSTLQSTTDYIDGFVYSTAGTTSTLIYFPTPEGRVLNVSGTLKSQYTITDQQGNARVTFDNSGTGGTAKVIQENSFYAFGMQLANSPVAAPAVPDKKIYNGGSELQKEYTEDLPDYYQTYYRNYDAAIGRFVAADPMAEQTESMSIYQYANNNPVMMNDPAGGMAADIIRQAYQNPQGYNNTFGSADVYNHMRGAFTQSAFYASDGLTPTYGAGIIDGGGGGHVDVSQASSTYHLKEGEYVRFEDGKIVIYTVAGQGYYNADHSQWIDENGVDRGISYDIWSSRTLDLDLDANQGGVAQSSFVGDNWKDIGFLANDLTQSFINRNTTLAISEGYNLAKSTVFLPLGLATRTSTGALSALSKTGGLLAKAAPWVAAGSIGINIAVNKQVTAGDVYQSIVTGASLVPGWGLIVGGGALLLEGGSYYFTGKSVSDNINSNLNGGVIYSWK